MEDREYEKFLLGGKEYWVSPVDGLMWLFWPYLAIRVQVPCRIFPSRDKRRRRFKVLPENICSQVAMDMASRGIKPERWPVRTPWGQITVKTPYFFYIPKVLKARHVARLSNEGIVRMVRKNAQNLVKQASDYGLTFLALIGVWYYDYTIPDKSIFSLRDLIEGAKQSPKLRAICWALGLPMQCTAEEAQAFVDVITDQLANRDHYSFPGGQWLLGVMFEHAFARSVFLGQELKPLESEVHVFRQQMVANCAQHWRGYKDLDELDEQIKQYKIDYKLDLLNLRDFSALMRAIFAGNELQRRIVFVQAQKLKPDEMI